MQETLVIYLHRLTLLSWVVIKQDQPVEQAVLQDIANCEQLTKLAANKKVIVVVPAFDVLLTSVNLPKMARARLLKAIPFALEDELINDIEELHFAISEKREIPQPVLVVAKDKLKEWIGILEDIGIKADVMVPISLAIPYEENALSVAIIDKLAVIRQSQWKGFACEKHNLNHLLKAAIADSEIKPEKINYYHYGDERDPAFASDIACYEYEAREDAFIADISKTLTAFDTINLLQKDFLPKNQTSRMNRSLIYVNAGILSLGLIIFAIFPFVSAGILKHYQAQLNDKIVAIYKKNFPNASSVIAPKERMESKLRSFLNDAPKDQLLLMLAHIGEGLNQVTDAKIKRLDYQNNQVNLNITALTSEDFNKFTNTLSQNGLSVHQQNAILDGERVNANLQIEMK